MSIVLITGGFDPLHSGHISYIKESRKLGEKLIVGINSDNWLIRKKGKAFMPWKERFEIISNLKDVHEVIDFNDDDDSSIDAISKVKNIFPNQKIIFANGGDRNKNNIPEIICKNVEFIFGVGGDTKKNSSSEILKEWSENKTIRPWGYYRVLKNFSGTKVKELTIEPKKSLSMQRHTFRNELWHVVDGKCIVEQLNEDDSSISVCELSTYDQLKIVKKSWHKLSNPYDKYCTIIEIQYGTQCEETDIERI